MTHPKAYLICPVTGRRCESTGCTVYIDGHCGLLAVNPGDAVPFLSDHGMVVWQNDYDLLRADRDRLAGEVERLRGRSDALAAETGKGKP